MGGTVAGGNVALGLKSMETKKSHERVEPDYTAAQAQAKKTQSFLSDIKAEFMKITWTPKEELRTYTKIVIGATFICGMGVFFMDLLIQTLLTGIEVSLKWIFG
jgi:preprotein translocase subunit SecE